MSLIQLTNLLMIRTIKITMINCDISSAIHKRITAVDI